jgi:hypothetical protein
MALLNTLARIVAFIVLGLALVAALAAPLSQRHALKFQEIVHPR